MNNKRVSLESLNITICGTDRDIDIFLIDKDEISIIYCSESSCCGSESQSTSKISFKELFYLIEKSKNTKRLYRDLESTIEENIKLKKTVKSLENQLDTLKSAIDIIKK